LAEIRFFWLYQADSAPIENALTESPVWSPDGEFLAFSVTAEDGADVWAYEVQGKRLHQVTHGANAQCPAWLPGE